MATPKKENARRQPGADTANNYTREHNAPPGTKQRAKNLIVSAACWRIITPSFAEWLIRRMNLREV